jgi:hypothetical protein
VISAEDNVLAELLFRKGWDLPESRFTVNYNFILGHLPAFSPLLTTIVTERDPFRDLRIQGDLGSMLAFESIYTPSSLFTSDPDLQGFTKMLNFANDIEWDRFVKSAQPQEIGACVIGLLEYTMNQGTTLANKSVVNLNLDVFIRQVQAWRMGLRSQISASRFLKLAGFLNETFDSKEIIEDSGNLYNVADFNTFSDAVQTIQGFWQLQMSATARPL